MCVFFANPESPLQFYVNYPNSGSVSAYGPGLVYGVANKTATFTIVTEDAGEGTVVLGYLLSFGEFRECSSTEAFKNEAPEW